MNLKNLVVGLALATSVLLALPAVAEGKGPHHHKHDPEKMVQRIQQKLGLSDQQVTQVKAIYAAHEPSLKNLREQMKQTFTDEQREAMRNTWKESRQNGQKLTPEQRKQKMTELGISQGQLDQMRSLREQMKKEREQMKQEVSAVLTAEQKQKLDEMKAEHKNKRRGKRGEKRAK